jgi:hypothetical protein
VLWADLVRYRPARTWDAAGAKWEYHDVAHVYRVYRDTALEAWFVRVWTATDDADKAVLRTHLTEQAERAQPIAIIKGNTMVAKYREHRQRLLAVERAESPVPDWWLAIESRTAQLGAALRTGVAINKRVLAEQIKAYASLL